MTTPNTDTNLDDTRWGAAVRWRDPFNGKSKVRRKTGLSRDEAVAFLRSEGRRRAERRIVPVAYTLWNDNRIEKTGRYWPTGVDKSLAISGTDPRRAERESDLDVRLRLLRSDNGLAAAFKVPSVWYPAGVSREAAA